MASKSHRRVHELVESYEPTREHVEFLQSLIAKVRSGGVWEVPMNGQCYVFNHEAKTLTMTQGRVDLITHRTRVVAALLGWRVLVQVKGEDGHITLAECTTS